MQISSDNKVTYKVGDTITIRDWDDMAEEFGLDDHAECIKMPFGFIVQMAEFCGRRAKVITLLPFPNGITGYKLNFLEGNHCVEFDYGKEMFVETYAEPNYDLRDKLTQGEFNAELI